MNAREATPKAEPRGFRFAGSKPLRRAQHEIFAQAFATEFDGLKAATCAGYGRRAVRAWPLLMARGLVRSRVAALASGLRTPGGDAQAVLKEIVANVFVDLSSLIRLDAKPGEEIYDLAKATPRQLRALDIRQEVTTTGGRKTVRNSIRPKDASRELCFIAKELGIGGLEATAPLSDFAEAIKEISKRGSKIPLRRDTDD